ncbi:MAG: 3-isopropylmalate dehydratase small subunit, partial [Oscillospiraceae bacterium]|nr:3-isopropylmalate dehydratase small subunit [Oscillospiraceae bacterium]
LECEQAADEISAGDEVSIDFDTGSISDLTTGKTYQAQPFPPFIQNIIAKGGLLASLKEG